MAAWWHGVEDLWLTHRSSDRLTLIEQLDFRRKLTSQLPTPQFRVVYGKAGMHVAAALVDAPDAIIDHKLYWAAVTSREEGIHLSVILNSPAITELVRPLMSYGKDERDIDKHLWKLPIPLYDPANSTHARLIELGNRQADAVAALDLDETANFVSLRRQVRADLAASPEATEIAEILDDLLAL